MEQKSLIILSLLFLWGWSISTAFGQQENQTEMETLSLPLDLEGEKVFIEKFTQVYIYDLEADVDQLTMKNDSAEFLSALVNLLEVYNKLLYRKYNEQITLLMDDYEIEDHLIPIYPRDLKEMEGEKPRFVVRNEVNLIDALLTAYEYDRLSVLNEQRFYLYDSKTDTRYRTFNNLEDVLTAFRVYYSLDKKGELAKISEEDFERSIFKAIKKNHRENSIAQLVAKSLGTWAYFALVIYGLSIVF